MVSWGVVAGPRSRSPMLQELFEHFGIEQKPDDLRKGVAHLLSDELWCELGKGGAPLPDETMVGPFIGAHMEFAARPEGDEPCDGQDIQGSRVQMLAFHHIHVLSGVHAEPYQLGRYFFVGHNSFHFFDGGLWPA